MEAVGLEEIVDETLELFATEARRLSRELLGAYRAGDLGGVAGYAHLFKSAAGMVGAKELSALLHDLECAAKRGGGADASRLTGLVEAECVSVLATLGAAGYGCPVP